MELLKTNRPRVTALLDAGISVHRVAERIGDPAVPPGNYPKRNRAKQADASVSKALAPSPVHFSRLPPDLGPL